MWCLARNTYGIRYEEQGTHFILKVTQCKSQSGGKGQGTSKYGLTHTSSASDSPSVFEFSAPGMVIYLCGRCPLSVWSHTEDCQEASRKECSPKTILKENGWMAHSLRVSKTGVLDLWYNRDISYRVSCWRRAFSDFTYEAFKGWCRVHRSFMHWVPQPSSSLWFVLVTQYRISSLRKCVKIV